MQVFRKTKEMMLLLVLVLVSCTSEGQTEVKAIDADELKELNKEGVILLDVRTPGEVEKGKIARATVINFQDAGFKEEVSNLNTDSPIIVYCAAGGRSTKASDMLKDAGFTKIYNYKGGFNDWKSRGEEIDN